jgi:hypothetical protein
MAGLFFCAIGSVLRSWGFVFLPPILGSFLFLDVLAASLRLCVCCRSAAGTHYVRLCFPKRSPHENEMARGSSCAVDGDAARVRVSRDVALRGCVSVERLCCRKVPALQILSLP